MEKELLPPEEVIIKLKKLIKIIEHHQSDFEKSDITPAQTRIIFPIIKYNRGHTMQELTEHAGVDKALVSRAVAGLESKGLVEREKKTTGEKNYKIVLTAKAQKLVEEKFAKHRTEFQNWHERFTESEIITFFKVLKRLTEE